MANRGPGSEPRAWAPVMSYPSNQYQRAGASHVPRVLVSRTLSVRCASPGMRPTDPNLLTRDRGARSPGPPPYVIDHDRGHEGCSKFCGLRGISVFPVANDAAADCVAQQLQYEQSFRDPELAN